MCGLRSMRVFLSGMEDIKVSFPPFLHSKQGIRTWWLNVIIAFVPLIIFNLVINPAYIKNLLVIQVSFIISGIFLCLISSVKIKYRLLKYVLWGCLLTNILPASLPLFGIILAVFIATFIEEIVMGSPGQTVFPAFLTSWIFLKTVYKFTSQIQYEQIVIILLGLGCAYLLIRRKLSNFIFVGVVLGIWVTMSLISPNPVRITNIVGSGLISLMILGYPGIAPVRDISRFLFGLICGILIAKFGFRGFIISVFFSPVLDRLWTPPFLIISDLKSKKFKKITAM